MTKLNFAIEGLYCSYSWDVVTAPPAAPPPGPGPAPVPTSLYFDDIASATVEAVMNTVQSALNYQMVYAEDPNAAGRVGTISYYFFSDSPRPPGVTGTISQNIRTLSRIMHPISQELSLDWRFERIASFGTGASAFSIVLPNDPEETYKSARMGDGLPTGLDADVAAFGLVWRCIAARLANSD